MQVNELLKKLGYEQSPNFLRGNDLARAPDYGHIFRRAQDKPCELQGVYSLRDHRIAGTAQIVPVVYVCRATSKTDADEIHRLVWNQDVVPFVLVHTEKDVRLYSGFRCQDSTDSAKRGRLLLKAFNDISQIIDGFHADAIDSGRLWKEWGAEVTPETRVEWKLLDSLQRLDKWLQGDGGLGREASHALIGKYVYLHYLRDRGILKAWFGIWNIAEVEIFGRCAKRSKLEELIRRLDNWLNGSVFPIDFNGPGAPSQGHISWVASVFAGYEVHDDGGRQLHLDFPRYDFKYIPIETLSVIYEQFLHAPDADDKPVNGSTKKSSRGREAGAYYTPLPVVNLMLAEMEDRLPLKNGMKILDPSCGSGAFLVQCYRRLIEKVLPAGKDRHYPLPELRKLLEDHIFGVDRDQDACSVTELSLTLTLLDYVHPPDLNGNERRKLPSLRDRNIFCADFFDDDSICAHDLKQRRFDWIVGNPPWNTLSIRTLSPLDRSAWNWIITNKSCMPVADNQVAQAFAWRVTQFLATGGKVGLLLPAMSLFSKIRTFRKSFFAKMEVHAIANFANLRHVLFRGRASAPAASFFFSPRFVALQQELHEEYIPTYAPMLANQESTRDVAKRSRSQSWNLVVVANEVCDIPLAQVSTGDMLPWKLALWGSNRDRRLLRRLADSFETLEAVKQRESLSISEGLQLRKAGANEEVEELPADKDLPVAEKDLPILDLNKLIALRDVFDLPDGAIKKRDPEMTSVRKGRAKKPLTVCYQPHLIVSEARHYAVYSEKSFVIPPRQVGIAGTPDKAALLKALALYLTSDFAFYHQFLTSTRYGVERDVANKSTLESIPIPFANSGEKTLRVWAELHSRLIGLSPRRLDVKTNSDQLSLSYADDDCMIRADLIHELNTLTNDSLGLDSRERALVHDLKHVRLELNDGKTGQLAVRPPESKEMRAYAKRLKSELDAFVGNESPKRHSVGVVHDQLSAMICVNFMKDAAAARKIIVEHAGSEGARQLERTRRRLRQKVSQWVYFDRNLRLYEGARTYLFKPMQRFHWTESQAMCDAGEIIAETLAGSGGDS